MHFSHSNLIDTCVAESSYFEARYRPFGSAPLHNLTSAHSVYWNTEGRASSYSYVVHSQQSRYGYVIGTRGAISQVNTGGTSTTKTNPVDHVEGAGQGDTLTPFSLFREQRRRRLNLPKVAPLAEVTLLFPANVATLTPAVSFGDAATIPPDATFAWAQTGGPAAAQLQTSGGAGVNAAFVMAGDHALALTVSRHGSLEDDFATTAPVTVRVLPPGWQSLDLTPVADAHVQSGNPDTNYNSTDLWMKGVNSAAVDRQIYMRFDLSALAGRTVHGATLVLRAVNTTDTAATATTHWVSSDVWPETGITWNTRPPVSDLLQTWALSPDYVQRLDLTGRTAIEAAGDGLLSLRHAIASQTASATIFRYASREYANAALRPKLTVLSRENWPAFAAWIGGYPAVPPGQRGPEQDPDADGRSNLEEYAQRSLPHLAEVEAGSPQLQRLGGTLRFIVPGGATMPPGVYLQVEYAETLTPADWQPIYGVPMAVVGADLHITPPPALAEESAGFFRLRYVVVP